MRDIGKNIKQLRQIKNMTQDELAEKLFVTRQTVSNYEIGRTRPDIDMLAKMAEVLDVDIHTVLYGLPEPVSRRKEIIKTCIAVAVTVLLFVAMKMLLEKGKQLAGMEYDMSFLFCVRIVVLPMVCFAAGWTPLQILSTFTKLTRLSYSWSKWIRLGLVICMGIYWILTLPILIQGVFPQWMPTVWLQVVLLLMGLLYGFNQLPWYLLFAFLFGGLWWLFPWRERK